MYQAIYWDNQAYYGTSDNPKNRQEPKIKTFGKKYKSYQALEKSLRKNNQITSNTVGYGFVDLNTGECFPVREAL